MGIRDLWKIVEPSATSHSLTALAVQKGLRGRDPLRGFRIGIDASIWFHQCEKVFLFGHSNAGENPELRTLFYRLARLSRMAVSVVFVFDGNGRPPFKRGRKVFTRTHWLAPAFKNFVSAFGFGIHQAPGEAEAELALMNTSGIIDAVITEDSDVLVFGAQAVIRLQNNQLKKDNVTYYRSNDIEGDMNLTRSGFLLYALLVGGDYHQVGLP